MSPQVMVFFFFFFFGGGGVFFFWGGGMWWVNSSRDERVLKYSTTKQNISVWNGLNNVGGICMEYDMQN